MSQTNKALKFAPSTSKMGATAPCALGRCHGQADELRVRHPTVEPEVAHVAESNWAITPFLDSSYAYTIYSQPCRTRVPIIVRAVPPFGGRRPGARARRSSPGARPDLRGAAGKSGVVVGGPLIPG